jgi:hypothetical protein
MNEYVVAAAESLMVDYCDSLIASSTSSRAPFEWLSSRQNAEEVLTSTQRFLKIPLALAVAALLSDCAMEDQDQPLLRNELFRRLQSIWFRTERVMPASRARTPKYYEWSPTLPLKDSDDPSEQEDPLRPKFRAALDQRCRALQQQTEQATRELLTADATPSRPQRTPRPVRNIVVLPLAASLSDDDTASDSSSTCTEGGRDATLPLPQPNDVRDEVDGIHEASEWTPVRGKEKPTDESTFVEKHRRNSLTVTTDRTDDEILAQRLVSEEALLVLDEQLSAGTAKDSPLSVPQWEGRIQHLERQLAEKEQQLLQERTAAHKLLQSETNLLHERIQALQLRLYISETRLQTYEEALRRHIESVAENTATSPGHRPVTAAETPPLYARGR